MSANKLTELNHYKLLGRSGLRVSPLCLGTMTFGTEWGWGSEREEARKIFDKYLDLGGNFIDTANFYTNGTSEKFIGEFIENKRDEIVLSTKYTLNMRPGDPNAGGNHRKSIVQALEASLTRLDTDYIDLYWLHIWDKLTPIDEVMRALDDLVRSGKILYIGISDTPAWKVAQANTMADLRGWNPFVALQIEYNMIKRDAERDLIPMAEDLNLAVTPWSPLARGILTGKYKPEDRDAPSSGNAMPRRLEFIKGGLTDKNFEIIKKVGEIATELNRSLSQISINWLMQKQGVTSPIIGAKTLTQFEENISSMDFILSPEQMKKLDDLSKIELGFPHDFINLPIIEDTIKGGTVIK